MRVIRGMKLAYIIHIIYSFPSLYPAMLLHTHVPAPVFSQTSPRVAARVLAVVSRSEHFHLSHFFRVHGAGFSPLHQIFIEGETGEAGSARALLSDFHPSLQIALKSPSWRLSLLFVVPCCCCHQPGLIFSYGRICIRKEMENEVVAESDRDREKSETTETSIDRWCFYNTYGTTMS